jgi:hypothetical protein
MAEKADCGVCGGESGDEFVGYAAVPGAPVTIGWCRKCLTLGCQPFFQVEYWFADHEEELTLRQTLKRHGLEVVLDQAIPHILEMNTFYDHEYILIGQLLEKLAASELKVGARVRTSGGSSPLGEPDWFVGTVRDGPDKVGNWLVEWDGTEMEHEAYGGRTGWEALDDDNVIG